MKNDKTENEIFAKIKQTLDAYQEDYIPGSWENYQQRNKARKRVLFLRIASGIAACLLIGYFGTELFYQDNHDKLRILTVKKEVPITEQNSETESIRQSAASLPVTKSAAPLAALATSHKILRSGVNESKAEVSLINNENAVKDTNKQSVKQLANLSEPKTFQTNKSDSLTNTQDSARVQVNFLAQHTLPNDGNPVSTDIRKRKVRFGINFSPGVSTAKSSSSFNFTGGLSADISLFSNFQLSTGLQVENQNIVQKIPGMASAAISSSTVPVNETKTNMINLDVPVNITWKFFSEKTSSYYVSAGLSSLVYLKQDYKNTAYYQEMVPLASAVAGSDVKNYALVDRVAVSENSGTPDQTFDFAGRVNIMVGFEKKLSNKLFIHIEPYAKIPASGLAPGILNHTSTGVNFKISF